MTKILTCALSYAITWAFGGTGCSMGFVPIPVAVVPAVPSRVARVKTSLMGPLRLAASPGDVDPVDRVVVNIEALQEKIQEANDEIRSVGENIKAVETAMVEGGTYLGIFKPEQLWEEKKMLVNKEKMLMDDRKQIKEQMLLNEKQMLMDKELRLVDEKKQLVKEKPRQFSLKSGVTKELADFSLNLVNATVSTNVLRLPEGVSFLGNNDMGSKIFVRKSYEDLADMIFGGVHEDTMRNIVVTGTPGIGKSVFSLYLLYLLRVKGETVVFDNDGSWYRFSDAQGVEAGTLDDFKRKKKYVQDVNSWLLCDPEEKPFKGFQGVTVVTVSPNPKRTNEFLKQSKPSELFMPLWTLEELQQCRKVLYPHISEEAVEYAFDRVGGTAREAFDISLLDIKMKRMAVRAGVIALEDLEGINNLEILSTGKAGDRLLVVKPDKTYKAFKIFFASPYAEKLVVKALLKKQGNQLRSIWSANRRNKSEGRPHIGGAVMGFIFEKTAHHVLEDCGVDEREFRRYIFGREEVDSVSFAFGSWNIFGSQQIPRKLHPNMYYTPSSLTFPAIDAIGECDGVLYLFQMKTGGIAVPIPLMNNKDLLQRWGKPVIKMERGTSYEYDKCVYVYVVPDSVPGVKDDYDFDKSVAKAKKIIHQKGLYWKRIDGCIWIDEAWIIAI